MKFWQVSAEKHELLFYGPIADDHSWFGDEITPKELAADLETLGGEPVTVRINSCGGDVFAANAIFALLKAYPGEVTVTIDGIAASAATIVAMAGDRITMPSNAIMMIHNPMIAISDYFTAPELTAMADSLDKIKDSIIAAYLGHSTVTRDAISKMMDSETWLTARDCLELGFADEITDDVVAATLKDGAYIVNSVRHDISKFVDFPIKREVGVMTKLEKIILDVVNKFGLLEEVEERPKADLEKLEAMRDGSDLANAVVDAAKTVGIPEDNAKQIIDAGKTDAQDFVADLVKDTMESGSGNIGAAPEAQDYERKRTLDIMVEVMNKKTNRR